jgi:hypothetical protein
MKAFYVLAVMLVAFYMGSSNGHGWEYAACVALAGAVAQSGVATYVTRNWTSARLGGVLVVLAAIQQLMTRSANGSQEFPNIMLTMMTPQFIFLTSLIVLIPLTLQVYFDRGFAGVDKG